MNATPSDPESKSKDGSSNQLSPSTAAGKPTFWVALQRHWLLDVVVFLLFVAAAAFIHHQDENLPATTLHQKNTGFGIALCAVCFCVFFVWRLSRFFAKDEEREELAEEMEAPTDSQQPPQNTPRD